MRLLIKDFCFEFSKELDILFHNFTFCNTVWQLMPLQLTKNIVVNIRVNNYRYIWREPEVYIRHGRYTSFSYVSQQTKHKLSLYIPVTFLMVKLLKLSISKCIWTFFVNYFFDIYIDWTESNWLQTEWLMTTRYTTMD